MRSAIKQRIDTKLAGLLLLLAMLCGLPLVGQATLQPAFAEESDSAITTLATDESDSLADRLAALDGVVSVTKLDAAYGYDQVYQLVFEQPISYDDSSVGTFTQRAILYYCSDDAVTIVNTSGYSLGRPTAALKFSGQYGADKANILDLEYRYFDESSPAGLDIDSTDLWEYLTCENAATDFHRIIQSVSEVLSGKRLWTGGSKGGFTTTYQCYFQEKHGYNDADAFVPWVSPLCDSAADTRMTDGVYTAIGDEQYGEEDAQTYRDLVLKFQLQCIKYRDKLQQRYYDAAIAAGCKFRESYFTSDPEVAAARLWDVMVADFAVGEWQYFLNWNTLMKVMAIEDEAQRIESTYQLIVGYMGYDDVAYNTSIYAYYMQAQTEMGNYAVDLSYLREAVAKEQETDPDFPDIALPEELDGSFGDQVLTEEQLETFTYSSSTRDALIQWAQTTTSAHIIMINGAVDPWHYVSMPDTGNETIHRYLASNCHSSTLNDLTATEQVEVWGLLNEWLAPDPEPEPEPDPDPADEPDPDPADDPDPAPAEDPDPSAADDPEQGQTEESDQPAKQAAGAKTAADSTLPETGDSPVPFVLALCLLASGGVILMARNRA